MKTDTDIISITNKTGLNRYTKASYPARYGKYIEIITNDYIYEFDLTGKIKFITGRSGDWPRGNWLKRTKGDDWVFYSAGEYSNVFPYTGEYYTPCLDYESNPFFTYKPFEFAYVTDAIDSLPSLYITLKNLSHTNLPDNTIKQIISNEFPTGKKLREIAGEISVLPPDARHSDYDAIPVIVADGCIYDCKFCHIKSGNKVTTRSKDNINMQIKELNDFYAEDIINYNSIFLGNHDFLNAKPDTIEFALSESKKLIQNSFMEGVFIFAFAGIFSFLNMDYDFFKMLNETYFRTYINIGLESFDQTTLDKIGKPVKADDVKQAFKRILEINKNFIDIEITMNLLIGSNLPVSHLNSIEDFMDKNIHRRQVKGCIYLSPLIGEKDIAFIKRTARSLKSKIKMPAYVYLIQRL